MTELLDRIDVSFTETALEIPAGFPFEEWETLGETLGRVARASGWWIGDWVNYGEAAYGEKYSQALEATGLEYGTLRNYAWVASRIEVSRRHDNLSFSHHFELAAMEPDIQDEWLDAAEATGMSASELRKASKGSTGQAEPASTVDVALTVTMEEWDRWATAAEHEGLGVATWLRQVANRAAG